MSSSNTEILPQIIDEIHRLEGCHCAAYSATMGVNGGVLLNLLYSVRIHRTLCFAGVNIFCRMIIVVESGTSFWLLPLSCFVPVSELSSVVCEFSSELSLCDEVLHSWKQNFQLLQLDGHGIFFIIQVKSRGPGHHAAHRDRDSPGPVEAIPILAGAAGRPVSGWLSGPGPSLSGRGHGGSSPNIMIGRRDHPGPAAGSDPRARAGARRARRRLPLAGPHPVPW
jgi:hypothetical protein